MSFGNQVRQFTTSAIQTLNTTYRRATFDLTSAIILGTPVDKGVLRNNWFVTFEQPSNETTNSASTTGSEAIGRARQNLSDVNIRDVVYITNNLPYATPIEFEGHSAQAPQGMVRINTARWDLIVSNSTRDN